MATSYLAPGVYVEELAGGSKPIEGVGTAVAGFIGFAERGPFNTPMLVTNWTQFRETFGDFVEGAYLAHAVYGFFNNGGGLCYVARLGADGAATATAPQPAQRLIPTRAGTEDALRVTALPGIGADVVVEIAAPAPGATPPAGEKKSEEKSGDGAQGAASPETTAPALEGRFTMTVRSGEAREVFENVVLKREDARFVETVVNQGRGRSKLVQVLVDPEVGGALQAPLPQLGLFKLEAAPPAVNLQQIQPASYVGDPAERSGLGGFDAVEDITMVCAPDLMSAYQRGWLSEDGLRAVQTAMIDHCERNGDRVAILDAPPGMKPQEIKDWYTNKARYDSSYGSFYYPWIKVSDPATGKTISVPPSGHIAGVWARVDSERGVHKAPANETIRGCIDLDFYTSGNEQELLNPVGINCIRAFSGRGIRIWGARTMSSDPEWRYLNVRRLFNYMRESIMIGTQWAVFEPNDSRLWFRLRYEISTFLGRLHAQGALSGATAAQAYFVKCDAENNPPKVVDAGQVVIEIGVAPSKPAEFVIFRIHQFNPAA